MKICFRTWPTPGNKYILKIISFPLKYILSGVVFMARNGWHRSPRKWELDFLFSNMKEEIVGMLLYNTGGTYSDNLSSKIITQILIFTFQMAASRVILGAEKEKKCCPVW